MAALLCLGLVPDAQARSGLELPYPSAFGEFDAVTYDDAGAPLGVAQLEIEPLEGGRIRMSVATGIDHGASNQASILLAPVAGTQRLRVLEQRSESRDDRGRSLGVLHVDHEAGVGHCSPADGSTESARSIRLPESERIANVALSLLFSPMALGEATRTQFQVFVCRGGPRVIEFSAAAEPRVATGSELGIVEIRYSPDLGPAIGWIADAWLPHFSFWLDGEGNYLAHRIPLYATGPEVLVVRNGLSPLALTPAP